MELEEIQHNVTLKIINIIDNALERIQKLFITTEYREHNIKYSKVYKNKYLDVWKILAENESDNITIQEYDDEYFFNYKKFSINIHQKTYEYLLSKIKSIYDKESKFIDYYCQLSLAKKNIENAIKVEKERLIYNNTLLEFLKTGE